MCNSFGLRVKCIREDRMLKYGKKLWSLNSLAKRINVSAQALSNIETCKCENPSLSVIKSLAEEFEVSTDFLIFGKDRNSTLKLEVEVKGDPNYLQNISTNLKLSKSDS